MVAVKPEKKTLAQMAAAVLPLGRYEFRVRFGKFYDEPKMRVVLALLPLVRLEGNRRVAVNGEDFETVFATFPLKLPRFLTALKALADDAKIDQGLDLSDFAEAFQELRLAGEVFCQKEPYRDVRALTVLK